MISPGSKRSAWILGIGTIALVVTALAPWWRNRAYVRHFFDYGLVSAGVTRIEEGERPYRDFSTPIQSGTFLFNLAAEKAGGGTFHGMTLGAGFLIALSAVALTLLLTRRWPPLPALIVAGAVVCGGVSQHTIIWYNSVGVVCLAVVAWLGAEAPVLRRETWASHAAMGLALAAGGINKLNFQLLALVVAAAWALRAGWTRRAGWGRVVATIGFLGASGLVLPVAGELAWTGVPFSLWWHNTVAMAVPDRTGALAAMFSPGFYFHDMQPYYGPLRLAAVGALGAGMTLVAAAVAVRRAWVESRWLGIWLPAAASLLAWGGGAALLATNYEIAYLGLAGWIALVAGLWLGFGLPPRGLAFYGGMVVPALLAGAVSWDSAWRGQRSQFGYSPAPRQAYREGSSAGPEFAYLKGTYIPPEDCESLVDLAAWHRTHPLYGGILYGPGLEWLERVWPVDKVPGLPLAIRWGASVGPRESAALANALRPGGDLQTVLVSVPQDFWRTPSREVLARSYSRHLMAPQIVVYQQQDELSVPGTPFEFLRQYGGNVDARLLFTRMEGRVGSEGWNFLGITHGSGTLAVKANCLRVTSQAVVHRSGPTPGRPISARFWVTALLPDGEEQWRWGKTVTLPPTQSEIEVSCGVLDGSGYPVSFWVSVPTTEVGKVVAGWRAPMILHVSGDSAAPPDLQGTNRPETTIDAAGLAGLFPTGWRPAEMVVRGGKATAAGLELPPGGELWVHVPGALGDYSGIVRVAPGHPAARYPSVWSVWYKAGRFEYESGVDYRALDQGAPFRAWSPEPSGWFGLVVDKSEPDAAPVIIQVTKVVPAP